MSDFRSVPVGQSSDVPARKSHRHIRFRYPWAELQPGDWFRFADTIKVNSARVMAYNNAQQLSVKFSVFRGTDDGLYCQRVDNVTEAQRADIVKEPKVLPKAPSGSAAKKPAVREDFPDPFMIQNEAGTPELAYPVHGRPWPKDAVVPPRDEDEVI
jgi:hypothetical protein